MYLNSRNALKCAVPILVALLRPVCLLKQYLSVMACPLR